MSVPSRESLDGPQLLAHSYACTWAFDFVTVVIRSVRRVNTRALLGVVGVFCDWLRLHTPLLAPNPLLMTECERVARCDMFCALALLVSEIATFKDLEKLPGNELTTADVCPPPPACTPPSA
jgi:hypothetical protein